MKRIIIYGGRFNPIHKGHKASYDYLQKKFGDNVYMASASNNIDKDNPFTWDEKKKIAIMMGIPEDKFIQVTNPYKESTIRDAISYDPNETIMILALSQKDGDRLISNRRDKQGYALTKNGKRQSIQWYRKGATPIVKGHIWLVKTPTVEFPIAGQKVHSGSEIRDLYRKGSSHQQKQILKDLYGRNNLHDFFNSKLGSMKTEDLLREFIETLNNIL